MTIHPEHEKEYKESLVALAEAMSEASEYFKTEVSKFDDSGTIHYITAIEGELLENEQAARERYQTARDNYFGKD